MEIFLFVNLKDLFFNFKTILSPIFSLQIKIGQPLIHICIRMYNVYIHIYISKKIGGATKNVIKDKMTGRVDLPSAFQRKRQK